MQRTKKTSAFIDPSKNPNKKSPTIKIKNPQIMLNALFFFAIKTKDAPKIERKINKIRSKLFTTIINKPKI
jgi:hypothetical protein